MVFRWRIPMQTNETIGNNATVRLFLAVFIAILIFLIFGYYAWWSPGRSQVLVTPPANSKTVVVPSNSAPPVTSGINR
ncbi:MAG: hypothetical protein H7Y17_04300 [Chlorobia bacterium]|nr:hypothetical protein [Fimbriimonadaceae bacterium]